MWKYSAFFLYVISYTANWQQQQQQTRRNADNNFVMLALLMKTWFVINNSSRLRTQKVTQVSTCDCVKKKERRMKREKKQMLFSFASVILWSACRLGSHARQFVSFLFFRFARIEWIINHQSHTHTHCTLYIHNWTGCYSILQTTTTTTTTTATTGNEELRQGIAERRSRHQHHHYVQPTTL